MRLHVSPPVLGRLLCGLAILWAGASLAQSGDKSLYRWTDANGQVHYSDAVPASAAKTERDLLRSNGNVKKVLPAEKSAEQTAREQADAAEKQKQEARDRALLATYSAASDIEAARDASAADLDRQIAETQRALGQATDTLDRLNKRKAASGEDVDPAQQAKLDEQIKNFERLVPADERILNGLTLKRDQLADAYRDDLVRFLKLKGAESAASLPPPPSSN